jgi:hypothetical protein
VVKTTLRIPGNWSQPGELIERMPSGFHMTPELLILPDDTEIELVPMAPDDQFARIFSSSCRQPPTQDEMARVDHYRVNIGLVGPGGSMEAALTMLQAGAALVRAGGAGVFIDNSALAHGGSAWIEMAEDGGPDALSFAFVAIVGNRREIWTVGMHVLGLPDLVMQRAGVDEEDQLIIGAVRSLCRGEKPAGDLRLMADQADAGLQVPGTGGEVPAASPMHNPFGRLTLVSSREGATGH